MASSSQLGGRYTLIRPLGEGATKEVFLARDESLQREVALCRFKPHVLSGGYLERIRREARTLAGLSHPNIVGIYDIREDDGCYLITEYVSGGSLRSKMASDWKCQPDTREAVGIAAEVADALAETHAKGIFHRDVKPNNVLLTKDGTAKLGDFGLARPHGDESISEEGLIVGTVPYMSPEQAKGLPPDSPSDMYSFGVVLFEMVAGRRPFHGEDASVLVHHLNTPPPPPTRYVPGCPPRLEALILQLLDKTPEARPTASDAAKELRRIACELSKAGSNFEGDEPAVLLTRSKLPEQQAHLPRRLVAILYADVAGYSRLTGQDEDATHLKLSEYLDLVSEAIHRHGGHVLHYAGDAVLAMFDAVVDAVSCAADFQYSLHARNEASDVGQRVEFRVGINLGDVIEDRGDIYGDGVNVAARLESLAEPGGICVSGTVVDAIGVKLPLDYQYIGEKQVKNIEKPVRAYRVGESNKPGAPPEEPEARVRPSTGRKPLFLAATFLLGLMVWFVAWWSPWASRDPPVPIDRVCAVEKQFVYEVTAGPAHASDLPSLYKFSSDNQPIFSHLHRLQEMHRDGVAHRGVSYVYGAPGVGKSFLVRNHLLGAFPGEASCVVKLGDVFGGGTEQLGVQVTARPDVTSRDGQVRIGSLPAVAEPGDFRLGSMLAASGCEQNGVLRSLVVIDDIDEIHPDSARLILRSVDKLVLDRAQSSSGFLHVIVVGGADGFAPWYRDPKRHGGIAGFLSAFEFRGPVYSTTGDMHVLAANLLRFQMGKEGWDQFVREGAAASLIEQYVRYVRRHPFLSYSIRSLAIATMISTRASTTPDDTEFELKEFVLDELLRRSSSVHGRPDPGDDAYRRMLEEVATGYADRLDDDGFFVVGLDDQVPITTAGGNTAELPVREVLDRSGIAVTVPGSHSTARYRFAPIWVQSHLIELANQRGNSSHQYRPCAAP